MSDLRDFERNLIAVRSIAAADAAWSAYRATTLPADLEPTVEAKMAQAWGDGYSAAMGAVRGVLLRQQNASLSRPIVTIGSEGFDARKLAQAIKNLRTGPLTPGNYAERLAAEYERLTK